MSVAVNSRKKWIDMARGLGAVFVIAGHMHLKAIDIWAYSYVIPLFFFISGYLTKTEIPFGQYFMKRVKTLVIPYFSMGLLAMIYHVLSGQFNVLDFATLLIVQKRFIALWFVACLFVLELLYYFYAKIKNIKIRIAVLVVLAIAGVLYFKYDGRFLPWNIDACFTTGPFFLTGVAYRKYEKKTGRSFKCNALVTLLLLVLSVGMAYLSYYLTGDYLDFYRNSYGFFPLTYLTAMVGTAFGVAFTQLWEWKPLCFIGANTWIYFTLNETVTIPIAEKILGYFGIVNTWSTLVEISLYAAAVILIVLAISTVLTLIIINSPLKFMLGK